MKNILQYWQRSSKAIAVTGAICLLVLLLSTAIPAVREQQLAMVTADSSLQHHKDSVASVRAFDKVYSVLMNPACMNCHPAGDVPLQGPDSHLHTMGVQRGVDGKGIHALKCANCHQATNLPGPHMPPGNPNWHLPPANMKMIFEGLTPRQLARQLLDTNENGHKSKEQLIEHVSTDHLVIGSWDHGEGHSVPPISHAAFVAYFKTWIEKGAYLPAK